MGLADDDVPVYGLLTYANEPNAAVALRIKARDYLGLERNLPMDIFCGCCCSKCVLC